MDTIIQPITYRLDSLNAEQLERQIRQLDDEQATEDEDRRLCCASCGRPITHEDQRIPVQGTHEHIFRNPHDMVFHIGCFAQAPGCGQVGSPTEAWSWFRGYAWEVALCLGCGVHLGWRYRGRGGDTFHGLILKHLKPAASP